MIKSDSLVTLRYRLSCDSVVLVSTMEGHPSTFQLGTGELAPPLEQCLIGQGDVFEQSFDLPVNAFGTHNAQLVRSVLRKDLPLGAALEEGATVTLQISPSQQATGLVKQVSNEAVLVDLNHPLAGKSVRFDVNVIGVL